MKKVDLLLLILFFSFSWWLMDKSFGYDANTHTFRIARHQVGDFGLHLSLIRSFSWGDNFLPESPYFPGRPLPYHYYFDLFTGLLVKVGVPIHIAFNGLSAIAFTALLWFIYKLPQTIFKQGGVIGIISIILFIFHSSLTFVDFFRNKVLDSSVFKELWLLPDYIHKGPFDGSIITIFFTHNVFLNQRHLIAALALSLGLLYFLLPKFIESRRLSVRSIILVGIILGLSSRLHSLIFLSTLLILFLLFVYFKQKKLLLPLGIPSILIFIPHLLDIANQQSHSFIHLGFLSLQPLTINSFSSFWFMNLGVALFLIPLGFLLAKKEQKLVFLSFFPLFIVGNILHLSFKVEHNHSLFNYFIILANFYIAFVLAQLWQKKITGKIATVVLCFFLTISGVIDLAAMKNDYQYLLADAPSNKLMEWIKNNTGKKDIFLAKQEIFDQITLAGRKNYFGHIYDMGYVTDDREAFVKDIFEAKANEVFDRARKKGIQYIIIPLEDVIDFPYTVSKKFYRETLPVVYEDDKIAVFKL